MLAAFKEESGEINPPALGQFPKQRAMSPVQDFCLTEEYWQGSWSDSNLDNVSIYLPPLLWQLEAETYQHEVDKKMGASGVNAEGHSLVCATSATRSGCHLDRA